jgi:hypothetical protein
MTRIRNVILVCDSMPRAVFEWLSLVRPPTLTDADMQSIYGIVDAVMSVIRAKTAEGFDFGAALARINMICKSRIGEVN